MFAVGECRCGLAAVATGLAPFVARRFVKLLGGWFSDITCQVLAYFLLLTKVPSARTEIQKLLDGAS